jgi:hypothetical protein
MTRARLGAVSCLLALSCQSRRPALPSEPPGPTPVLAGSSLTRAAPGAGAEPTAVVELFTSEGCSSCPAADQSLAELTERAQKAGQRVVTLELHVDYWDYLGWKDPFSDALHSRRQEAYARRFGSGMYTPQMVVNGREQLVGSDAAGAAGAVARALATPSRARVTLDATRGGDGLQLAYRVAAGSAVKLALVVADDAAQTRVTRGENSDRLLLHRHVVRAFRIVSLPAGGAGTWSVPWPQRHGGVFVAAYASDPSSLEILGGDFRALPAAG